MTEFQVGRTAPACQCWIKHILEGRYSSDDKILLTIFGKFKKVRIGATIIDKREILTSKQDDDLEEDKIRIEFYLDDGTGKIRSTLWGVNPDDYEEFKKGGIVDIIGGINEWNNLKSISPIYIIKKIEDPNVILLRNAEIIKRIKSGEIQKIPKISEESLELDDFSSEIDGEDPFEDADEDFESADIKDKIYTFIESYSTEGNGISFKKILEKMEISEEELKNCLRDLEMESKIYQSEENIYQSF